MNSKKLLLTFSLLVHSTFSHAIPITIDFLDRGWYSAAGQHIASNQNTITGPGYQNDTNSWFLFDLSSLSGPISSATLRLEMENWTGSSSSGISSIWDYGSSLSALVSSHSSGSTEGIAINADLESGSMYSSQIVNSANVGDVIDFVLSAQAIADINSALGGSNLFALGTHLDTTSTDNWLRWSYGSESRVHQLVVDSSSVPEPTSLALLCIGFMGIVFSRKKMFV